MEPVNLESFLSPSKAEEKNEDVLLTLTTQIVASHLSSTHLPTAEVPHFIDTIHTKLKELSHKDSVNGQIVPAIPVSESVTPDFIFCLEDGKKFRMLKKHLRSCYDMSPEEYRAKWGLAVDYPMVAPNYAVKRRELAKQSGLGKKRT